MSAEASTRLRGCASGPILVGGFGLPWQRDLDFGSRFVCCAQYLDWPEGVVVEDLSYSALFVLDRLQELRPSKLILVASRSRGDDEPGTLRRYLMDPEPPSPEEVHGHLLEAVGGAVDLDHSLAVARHWGALPSELVLLEVVPRDTYFGLGLSEDMAASIDRVLSAVREELGIGETEGSSLSDERIYSHLLAT
jgi:hydrogenase maturation protease